MFVIIDLEWITDKENIDHLTQLYAVRTTKSWDVVDRFDSICAPPCALLTQDHLALSGYDIYEFSSAASENQVVGKFIEWLKDDDVLLFWHNASWMQLTEMAHRTSSTLPAKGHRILGNKLRHHYGKEHGSAYTICRSLKFEVPLPEHCSKNDVCAILTLLLYSGIDLTLPTAPTPPVAKIEPNRREKNRETISRTDYNYLFAEGSSIFHKRSCPCMLNAKLVLGSVYYETASKNRVACRLCKPSPEMIRPHAVAADEPDKEASVDTVRDEIVSAKLITGERITLKRSKIVGCCHYINHPGKLTKDLMIKHDCINKACRYFEKYTDASYWIHLDDMRKRKELIKEKKRREKERLMLETQDLETIKNTLANYTENSMDVIRVERDPNGSYKVFYVSDHPFADGDRFPGFLEKARLNHPNWRLTLRHIKDVDGHFVTREEFRTRARK